MSILRFGHDPYGERILNGVSWDLLPVALVLMVLAGAFPYIYFKWKRWL